MKTGTISLFVGISLLCTAKIFATNIDVFAVEMAGESTNIALNYDDDDQNGQPDRVQGSTANENDLTEFEVKLKNIESDYEGSVTVSLGGGGGDKIKLWKDKTKSTALPDEWTMEVRGGQIIETEDKKKKFFVEGVKSTEKDAEVELIAKLDSVNIDTQEVAVQVGIIPDAGMEGMIGGIVKSEKEESKLRHFVSPKKPGEYVNVISIDLDSAKFDELYEWEGGEAIDDASKNKRRVKRDSASKTSVKIKSKSDGKVVAEMMVWVVWVDFVPKLAGESAISGTLGLHSGRILGGYKSTTGIDFVGTIKPTALITDQDRPALEKQSRQSPPGSDFGVAGPGWPDASESGFAAWDVSRQRTIRAFKGASLAPTVPADGFPYVEEDYPINGIEGNDDSGVGSDEDSNPYEEGIGQIGEIVSNDEPRIIHQDTLDAVGKDAGVDGDRMHFKVWFREFARLQIGGKWYMASEYVPWRFQFFIKRVDGKWNPEPGTHEVFDTTNGGLP